MPVDKPLNTEGLIRIPVESDTGGVLPTGIYLIRVTSPEQSQNDFGGTTRHLMVVSDNNVTLKAADKEGLVWATNLQSGQETPDVPIRIYDPDFDEIASGTTDQAGLYKYDVTTQRDPNINLMAVIATTAGRSAWRSAIGMRALRHGTSACMQTITPTSITPTFTPTNRFIAPGRRCTSRASCAWTMTRVMRSIRI